MKKRNKKPPFPNPFQDEHGEEKPFQVDSLGIPILEDVVEQSPLAEGFGSPPESREPPDHDALPAETREHLQSRLEDELNRIIGAVLPEVVANATRNLESQIRQELQQRLEEEIAALVEQSLDAKLNRP